MYVGAGERAPDSAMAMITTMTIVARMEMFLLVWLFLTNVFRLFDVDEHHSLLEGTCRKGRRGTHRLLTMQGVLQP